MNWNLKTDNNFQKEWDLYKDYHSTEDYELKYVFEIYLPFWKCKQNVVVEKEIELDRFSKIILNLINSRINKHLTICEFLGIETDNFCTMQFNFLIKNNLIREIEDDAYEITHEGHSFLENRTKPTTMETDEFEYMSKEKMYFLENDITSSFFDPLKPIDKQLSELKKNDFSGYNIIETHKIKERIKGKICIKHSNNPTFGKITEKRNDFAEFLNIMNPDKIFYDFADSEIETHKRTICFLSFWYENKKDSNDRKIDIRQFKNSVNDFNGYELERELSKKVTEYVLKNDIKSENTKIIDEINDPIVNNGYLKYCPSCGAAAKIKHKFCTKCGEKFEEDIV